MTQLADTAEKAAQSTAQKSSGDTPRYSKPQKPQWRRLLGYLLWLLLLLAVLLLLLGYYFLNTNSGLKQAISLANRYSGYEVKADSIKGRLLHKSELNHLSIKGKLLNFQSEQVVLNWQPKALFDKSLTVKAIHIKNSVVELIPEAEKKKQDNNQPIELNEIKLPFDFRLADFLLENLTLRNPVTQKADFVIDHLQIGIDYIGQIGKINTAVFRGQGLDLNLEGQIETRGDFPLKLVNATQYRSKAYGDEVVEMTVKGSLKKQLAITMSGKGLSDFILTADIHTPLTAPQFKADFVLQKVDTTAFGFVDTAATATLSASGQLGQTIALKTQGEVAYQSPQTDRVKLNFVGEFDGQTVNIPTFNLGLLTAKQQLTGQGSYRLDNHNLDLKLHSDRLDYPQQNPEVTAKNLVLTVSGSLDDYHAKFHSDVKSNFAGDVPLQLQADGSMTALNKLTAQATVNGKPLNLSGHAQWSPTLAYQAQITAADILPIQQFPGIKGLDMVINGDANHYLAKGGLSLYSPSIAPAEIALDINGNPKTLQQADLHVKTLGGLIHIQADGDLSPLDIQARIGTKNIQPQQFYQQVNGNINSDLTVRAKQVNGLFDVVATIEQLSGQFQRQPLQGKGVITYQQADNQVDITELAVDLAGNQLQANGRLALNPDGQSDLTARLDGKQLKRLLPDLNGRLLADIRLQGNLSAPEVNGKIDGRGLSYQQHQIKQLQSDIVLSLQNNKVAINTKADGIHSGSTVIDTADIAIDGRISEHQIKVAVKTPKEGNIPQLNLAGSGGLDTQSLTWTGSLQQLSINQALLGKWQLTKPTALVLSADNIMIKHLCLQQKPASLCAHGKMQQQQGQFNVGVKNLKTQAFAQLLPDSVKLDTTLNADADIVLLDGQPQIKGKLAATGGRLQLMTGSGVLDDKIEQLETRFSLVNQKLKAVADSRFSKLGQLNLAAEIPNVGQSQIQAKVKINTPKLDFIQDLVPQLSDVKGQLNGDMTVSGTPGKQLNVTGKVTLDKTNFNVPQFGTQIRDLQLDIFAQNGNQIGFKGGAKAGGGDFNINGTINPATQQGEINLKGKNFQVADSRSLKVAIDPDLQIILAKSIKIRGEVVVPKALIIPESSGSKIAASDDVVLPGSKDKKVSANSPLDIAVDVKLGDDVRVASADIETRLLGGIKVIAKPGDALTANGVISIKTGALRVYGQQLNIERGRVIFSNGPIANPALDVRAIREIDGEDTVVGVNVLGYVSKPEISLFSTPSMPDSSVLSYLLFGKPPDSDTFSTTALLQTGGLVGANTIARDVRSATGLDVLDISFHGLEAGKNLTKKIYVGVHSNFFDAINQFLLKYKISGRTRVEAAIGTDGISTDVIREFETD